jgi:hypothetical protein
MFKEKLLLVFDVNGSNHCKADFEVRKFILLSAHFVI